MTIRSLKLTVRWEFPVCFMTGDWLAAEKQFQRALELNAGSALAHHEYALYLMAMARLEEALTEEKQALQLDPLSLRFNAVLAWARISSLKS